MENNKNNETQNRREFFKEAAKKALPILGAVALLSNPAIAKAMENEASGCTGTCTGACYGSCKDGCKYNCDSCSGSCKGSCYTTCQGTCSGSCSGSCMYHSK